MKEIKRTRTIEEVTGYEAEDGTWFKTKEECEKYEETAKAVIRRNFKRLMIGEEFPECHIWERFGYGSEEFNLAIIEIKNEDDLRAVNMLAELEKCGSVSPDYIGKRVLVSIGYNGEFDCNLCPRTEEELIDQFKNDIAKFFHPKAKESDNNDKSEM